MLARSTVVWVQRWQADKDASPERMKAGAGAWVRRNGSASPPNDALHKNITFELCR